MKIEVAAKEFELSIKDNEAARKEFEVTGKEFGLSIIDNEPSIIDNEVARKEFEPSIIDNESAEKKLSIQEKILRLQEKK